MSSILTPPRTFAAVSFFIGELGEGLNYFQAIYLVVGLGWNESAVGLALSLMGFTTLLMQTCAGDIVDKASIDRRIMLSIAALLTAASAMVVMIVREGNQDHGLMYISKIIEGVACSFLTPCLTALTLANFGPEAFDRIMALNLFWGLVGYATSATLVGVAAYVLYPHIKFCFGVIGLAAMAASVLTMFLPEGNPRVGSGFRVNRYSEKGDVDNGGAKDGSAKVDHLGAAASYRTVFLEKRTIVFCVTGFLFHLANCNAVIILGELLGAPSEDGQDSKRHAIPLMAVATLISQMFMCLSVIVGNYFTQKGVGRKILFLSGISTLPLRCWLMIQWRNHGPKYLLLTHVLDGIEGGIFRVIHPYIVVDLTYGTGRFNVIMGLSNSCIWLGRTFSMLIGQALVEHHGHVFALYGSMWVSFLPICIFAFFMPETIHARGGREQNASHYEIESQGVSAGVPEEEKLRIHSDYLKMV